MGLSLLVVLIILVGLAGFAFWLWTLIDALQRPDTEWQRAGQSKLIWVLVLIFVGVIGSIIYLVVARPQLDQARNKPW
jgi:heme/copper-type cytochrome/quinol oxidase subunit 2